MKDNIRITCLNLSQLRPGSFIIWRCVLWAFEMAIQMKYFFTMHLVLFRILLPILMFSNRLICLYLNVLRSHEDMEFLTRACIFKENQR